MLESKHFKTEKDLLDFVNKYRVFLRADVFRSIVKDVTNGDWVLFYIEHAS